MCMLNCGSKDHKQDDNELKNLNLLGCFYASSSNRLKQIKGVP